MKITQKTRFETQKTRFETQKTRFEISKACFLCFFDKKRVLC